MYVARKTRRWGRTPTTRDPQAPCDPALVSLSALIPATYCLVFYMVAKLRNKSFLSNIRLSGHYAFDEMSSPPSHMFSNHPLLCPASKSKAFSSRTHYLTFRQMLPAPFKTKIKKVYCLTIASWLFIFFLSRAQTPLFLEPCVPWFFTLVPRVHP